jgi:hypothetical protein
MLRKLAIVYLIAILGGLAQTQIDSSKAVQGAQASAAQSAGAAKTSATEAGKSAGNAKTSATEARKSAGAAKTSATEAGKSADNAKTSATEAGKSERGAREAERHVTNETRRHSQAVPVVVQVQPLSGGSTITLKASCGTLPKRLCARLAKPIAVEVWDYPNQPPRESDRVPKYSATESDGSDTTITLTVTLAETVLKPGDLVRLKYGDRAGTATNVEPVIPAKSDILCCGFDLHTPVAWADVRVGVTPYLLASDSNGNSRMLRVDGKPDRCDSHPSRWKFDLRDAGDTLQQGDTVSISIMVDGQPQQLAKTTVKSAGGSPAAPPAAIASVPVAPAAPAPANPTASGPPQPWVATAGSCIDPVVTPLTDSDDSVTATLGCVPADLSKLVLYIDNKPQQAKWEKKEKRSASDPQQQYVASLSQSLKPYQVVKALLFDPPQIDHDSPPQIVTPAGALPAGPIVWWVPNAEPKGKCGQPTITDPLYPGEALRVTVPCPASDPANLVVYVDNMPQDSKNVTWAKTGDPAVLMATLSPAPQPFQRVKVLEFNPPQNAADSAAVVVSGAPFAPPPPPAASTATATGNCAAPYMANVPGTTDSITVTLGCLPSNPDKDLTVLIDGSAPDGKVVWSQQAGVSPITYTAKLPSKLQAGQSIKVKQANQRDPDSPAQVAVAPPAPPATIFAVQEGTTTVAGSAPGLDKVRVQLVDGGDVKAQAPDAPVDATSNLFTATFTTPLQADQELKIFGVSKSGAVSDAATQVEVQPYGLDWGRVRGYFTAGVILSNNGSQLNLTNANTFLGFNLDKDWLRPARSYNSIGGGFKERFRFHTYFDARLTAIASGTSGSSSGSTPTLSSGSSSSGGTTGTTGSSSSSASSSSSSTSNPSANPTSLLSNGQAAALQVGAYFPFIFDRWDHKERLFSLYVAPIAKVGFYTLTSAGSSTSQTAENATRGSGTFFPFYAYGLRVGHYREYETWDGRADRSRAPEQLSYLDIMYGKWGNFEYLAPFNFTPTASPTCTLPASDPTTAACDQRQRLWRYGFEGLLVIPNTPLVVGLSANVAAQKPKGGTPGAIFLSPPDDLRFLFGVRFDASKFTGLLSKLGGQ